MEIVFKIIMLASILVAALGVAGCSSGSAPPPVAQGGSPAPDFQLQSLDGQTVSLSSLRGSPVMLNLWATWCGPCKEEMPLIQEVFENKRWSDQGLVILAINLGESPAIIRDFIEGNKFTFQVLLDSEQKVADMYNVSYIPVTYFIDKNGIIKDKKIGSFANKAEIEQRLINSILDDEPAGR